MAENREFKSSQDLVDVSPAYWLKRLKSLKEPITIWG